MNRGFLIDSGPSEPKNACFMTYSKNAARAEASHMRKYRTLELLMPQHLSPQQSLLAQLPHTQHAACVAMEAAADAIAGAAAAATTAAIVT